MAGVIFDGLCAPTDKPLPGWGLLLELINGLAAPPPAEQ